LATAGAEGANDSNFGAAAHNGNGDGVVNEERAYDERDVTEKAEIPAKCGEHFTIFVCGGAGETDLYTVRKNLLDAALPLIKSDVRTEGRLRNADVNEIDMAKAIEGRLRGGDVHDDGGFVAIRIGIGAADGVVGGTIVY
jgi:hypothetical protein